MWWYSIRDLSLVKLAEIFAFGGWRLSMKPESGSAHLRASAGTLP